MAYKARRGGQGRSQGGAADRLRRLDEYHRQVAERLIEQIEKGTAPWTQAWAPGEQALPANVQTGKAYRGGNSVWLMSMAEQRGYDDHRWGTYNQVKGLGGQVQRGETGTRILYWHFEDRRAARDSEGRPVRDEKGATVYETRALQSPRVYTYTVFNAVQCDGLPPRAEGRRPWAGHPEADRVLKGSGARIEHAGGDRAFYDIRGDRIVLPYRERFPEAAGYYQAALHELGHWTGHASRLNRATLQEGIVEGPYSKQYAREELRAEISSMMTGDRLDLGHDPARSASYVGHWVKALREDSREIYRAARDAQDISDFLIQPERDRVAERETEGREAAPAKALEPVVRDAPVPEVPAGAIQRPGAGEPGDQYRLFQRTREDDRSAPGR